MSSRMNTHCRLKNTVEKALIPLAPVTISVHEPVPRIEPPNSAANLGLSIVTNWAVSTKMQKKIRLPLPKSFFCQKDIRTSWVKWRLWNEHELLPGHVDRIFAHDRHLHEAPGQQQAVHGHRGPPRIRWMSCLDMSPMALQIQSFRTEFHPKLAPKLVHPYMKLHELELGELESSIDLLVTQKHARFILLVSTTMQRMSQTWRWQNWFLSWKVIDLENVQTGETCSFQDQLSRRVTFRAVANFEENCNLFRRKILKFGIFNPQAPGRFEQPFLWPLPLKSLSITGMLGFGSGSQLLRPQVPPEMKESHPVKMWGISNFKILRHLCMQPKWNIYTFYVCVCVYIYIYMILYAHYITLSHIICLYANLSIW